MAEKGRSIRTLKYLSEVVPNAQVYEKGHLVCYDTSTDTFKNGAAANANLIPVGYWAKSGTGTGAIVDNVIELFDEVLVVGFENNPTTNTVVAADRFSSVYLDGDHVVCNLATGRSVAGRFIMFSRPDQGYNPPLVYVSPVRI